MAQRRLAQHHAAEERAQCERHAEESRRSVRHTDSDDDHREREQLA